MEYSIFLKGILVGFTLAVPIGPIGLLCIHQTISKGRLPGFIIGLGGATADLIYSGIAAFGLKIISSTLYDQRIWIRIIGGIFFFILGIRILFMKNEPLDISSTPTGILKSYAATVLLTLTNPLTIFAFITVFAVIGIGNELSHFSATILALGVFFGSLLWFVIINSTFTLFKNKFSLIWSVWVNRITGSLIILTGIVAIISLF